MIERKTIFDYTNKTDGTYYSKAVSPSMFSKIGWQLTGNGGSGTVVSTIVATMEDETVADQASETTPGVTYIDVMLGTFGVAQLTFAAGVTSRELLIDNTEKLSLYRFIRVKSVFNTGGANDGDLKILQAMKVPL